METPEQMLERVRWMAEGKRSLLFDNDHAALRYVLAEAESARQDKALVDYLEISGLSTARPSSMEDRGIHSWGQDDDAWVGWTVSGLSSEFKSLREAFAALAAWKARAGE